MLLIFAALVLQAAGCGAGSRAIPVDSYQVVNNWPHDAGAFTQGLVLHHGMLFESTGLNGQSTLRKVDLETGRVLKKIALPDDYFGEGLALLDGKLFQLTWRRQTGFIYDPETLKRLGEFSYRGEGWGLTTDGRYLILSDGTRRLRFLDPVTFETEKVIEVDAPGASPLRLNELEYVEGELYANLFPTDRVARIDPNSGELLGYLDFSGLLPPEDTDSDTGVLNGIAYDPANDRLFVTGKRWPWVFEVRVIQGF